MWSSNITSKWKIKQKNPKKLWNIQNNRKSGNSNKWYNQSETKRIRPNSVTTWIHLAQQKCSIFPVPTYPRWFGEDVVDSSGNG